MIRLPVVVDTNIVVAGLLTGNPTSPTAKILDLMLSGRLPFVLSIELLAEYRAVLLRPRIRSRHRRSEEEIDVMLHRLAANAQIRELAPATGRGSDGDAHLWALLDTLPGAVLVTGDALLHRRSHARGRVVTALGLLELVEPPMP
jgi:predicted nucleic acid-binding protein